MKPNHRDPRGNRDPLAEATTDPITEALPDAMADAMAELQPYEPTMPDLLGPAMAEGTRIRRRRHATLLVALTSAVALVAGGVAGGIKYIGGDQGRGVGPAVSPTGAESGDASAARALPPVEALAETLRPYLEPRGITLTEKPWGHAEGSASITVTLRDSRGRTGALALTPGDMRSAMPSTVPDNNCEVPAELDEPKVVDYDQLSATCKMVDRAPNGAVTWSVVVQDDANRGNKRVGAVRLGPARDLMRVWTWASDPTASSRQIEFDNQLLTDIAADPEVASSARAVAATTGILTPPAAWPLDVPDTYAPTNTPSSAASRRPAT